MTSVNVLTNEQGHPSELNGPQRPVRVSRILDFWQDGGRWWMNEPARHYYLLELETGNVCEVFKSGESWTLSGVSD
jgi:hypothetical protein